MRLPLCALVLITLAGCDSDGPGVEPVDDVLIVSLGEATSDGPGVQIETEGTYPCGAALVVDVTESAGLVRMDVQGVDLSGTTCAAAERPLFASAALPIPNPTVDVEVRHRGATDLYRYACGFAGCDFTAVRASTTRLGPR